MLGSRIQDPNSVLSLRISIPKRTRTMLVIKFRVALDILRPIRDPLRRHEAKVAVSFLIESQCMNTANTSGADSFKSEFCC